MEIFGRKIFLRRKEEIGGGREVQGGDVTGAC